MMVKSYKTKTWQHLQTGEDGKATLFGVNIFDYKWKDTYRTVTVFAPLYNQKCVFHIYNVEINGEIYEFAAGEFSNNIWGFYTYRY